MAFLRAVELEAAKWPWPRRNNCSCPVFFSHVFSLFCLTIRRILSSFRWQSTTLDHSPRGHHVIRRFQACCQHWYPWQRVVSGFGCLKKWFLLVLSLFSLVSPLFHAHHVYSQYSFIATHFICSDGNGGTNESLNVMRVLTLTLGRRDS